MTWYGWLSIVVVITAIAAVTGFKPKGTQHLARTHMMQAARVTLLVVLLGAAALYLVARARSHG